MQVLSLLALCAASWAAVMRSWRRPTGKELQVSEPVAVIVPCYLPNEEPIIAGTLRHLLDHLTGVDDLTVYLAYNTPRDMPEAEAELGALAEEWPNERSRRRLVVTRVEGSNSKAENLNNVLPSITAPYIAIYDADHHPDPESLATSIRHLNVTGCDCVQGSTYIREGCLLARWLVCAEFFVNYFVILPSMQALSGTGFFGGANGIWRASSLKSLRFDEQALTEDIDCFARAIVQHGFRFEFLPESCSGELLPSGLRALWKQRLRWAMGWDQVTLRHASTFWGAKTSCRVRVGLIYIFFCRWLTQTCAFLIVALNVQAAVQWRLGQTLGGTPELDTPMLVSRLQVASFCGYCVFIVLASRIPRLGRGRRDVLRAHAGDRLLQLGAPHGLALPGEHGVHRGLGRNLA
eukprot:CAMPEP_0176162844 /NCGR_PEP_ID=MMETSP0120_2-20121206/83310_1 /TAXON_ID=160619 /ORGANISM="Kryptoperidinium foliaceum, Strain CCMP 1326" /LENGTH=405 /DNA_ID=CAMNT_0017500353 /DNA_START=142 /DNA_END=1356 /DNA_ORIENTATION=-